MAGTRKGFTVSYSSSYKNGIKMWENKIHPPVQTSPPPIPQTTKIVYSFFDSPLS